MRSVVQSQPERTCVGCRSRAAKSELVRLVLVDGQVAVDLSGRRSGRGAYVHRNPECVTQAIARRAFPRAFRQAVEVDQLTKWFEAESLVREERDGR